MTTKIISLDFELCSTLDLSDVGAYEWTKSKNTVPILAGFALDHAEPDCIVFDEIKMTKNSEWEHELLDAVDAGAEIHAWNANFEFNVWNNICVPRFGWPKLDISRFFCTMCAAACAGLPMSLDQAALAVGSPFLKDKAGSLNMMRMARPRSRNPLRWWHLEDPAKLVQLVAYNLDDVRAEREVHKRVPKMTPREREIWLVDQAMNARGLPVDGKLLDAMAEITLQELLRLSAEINVLTGGFVTASSQNARLLNWCQNRGYPHATLERETLSAFIGSTEFHQLPTDAQDVLRLRAEAGKTSTAKLLALQNYASTDGYARNLIQYGAAVRTLRWGGRGPQIQNFPRPVIQASNIAPAIDVILDDLGTATDALRTLYGNPLDVISSCLRGVFRTPKGWSFVVCDYSAIEAVVLAWLAEFEPLLGVFRRKEDVYVVTAAGVGSTNRQLGKVLRLACVGEDVPVLTGRGWVPIQQVQLDDLVWDGVEWVKHQGLVSRGSRETIELGGSRLTRDHRVLCGETWTPAGLVARNADTFSRALASGSASLPSLASNLEVEAAFGAPSCNARAARLSTLSTGTTSIKGEARGATPVREPKASARSRLIAATLQSAPTTRIAADYSTGLPRASTDVKTLERLNTPTMVGGASAFTRLGRRVTAWATSLRDAPISSLTSSIFPVGITPNWNWTGLTTTRATSPAIFASSRARRMPVIGALFRRFRPALLNSKPRTPTYDLAFAGPRNRFTIWTSAGPLIVHNCGYGMGYVKFQETANKAPYNLNLTLADAHSAVAAFRLANAPIVQLWHGVEATARNAILRPSDTLRFKKLGFRMAHPKGRLAGALLMELPSGRNLVYRNARLENGRIVFWGVDQMTRRWKQLDTYGGKLVENATQAVARDLLADSVVELERQFPGAALTTVHDEIIAMTEDGSAPRLLDGMKTIMGFPPAWGRGLPLSSSGSISKRYGK